jgi:hypothetical protein
VRSRLEPDDPSDLIDFDYFAAPIWEVRLDNQLRAAGGGRFRFGLDQRNHHGQRKDGRGYQESGTQITLKKSHGEHFNVIGRPPLSAN